MHNKKKPCLVSEKNKPTYDLDSFKSSEYELKGSALKTAFALGFSSDEIDAIIQSMQKKNFYKSMTSYNDHTQWQDVYHVPWDNKLVLYIKFTSSNYISQFDVLSFKEK